MTSSSNDPRDRSGSAAEQNSTGRRAARMASFALASLLCIGGRAADAQPRTLPLGAAAPDFSLPGVDGRTYALRDFAAARALVVVFTCNHCPTAQYYEGRLMQLAADYRDKGVALVAISPNDPQSVRLDELGWTDLGDSFADMKLRAKERRFDFPYLYDGETQKASRAYGPVATPHVFLFDRERKLRYAGRIDDSERAQHVKVQYLREALDAVLEGRMPPVAQTKVVGCSVKWSGKADAVKAFMEKLAAEPVSVQSADADALKQLRAGNPSKFRLVTFWATWCAPCVVEFDEFVTMHRMYRHREFELVTVSVNRPEEHPQVLEFLKQKQASTRNFIFASSDRAPLIDAFDPDWQGVVPYTVLISPEGKVVSRAVGSIDALEFKREIVRALNDRKPW
ncbi:MAG: redoxin domain-containing protein [Verrucomicrobiota bacterium]|nr:redoxin domain-containing protein [Verrucomicrobiota bacterium]HOU87820.1 redoxin domain-containing protein [Verrucomicrobiota bacterium]